MTGDGAAPPCPFITSSHLQSRITSPPRAAPATDTLGNAALAAAAVLGAVAIVTQLVLMRELLAALSGNELVIGISLGTWLLLTGAGAWLGRIAEAGLAASRRGAAPRPEAQRLAAVVAVGLTLLAILPMIEVGVIRGCRDVAFPRGAAIGVAQTIAACAAVLAPFCLISGALLTVICGLAAEAAGPAAIGRVYFCDAVGAAAAGVLFTFALVPLMDHFALLAVTAVATASMAVVLATKAAAPRGVLVAAGAAVLCAGSGAVLGDRVTTGWQYHGEIVRRVTSPYARLVVTRDAGQLAFFENGIPVAYDANVATREETAHFALLQRPAAAQVLLVSGAIPGVAREVLRYPVGHVTCLERDGEFVAAGRALLPQNFADDRLEIVTADPRAFLRRGGGRFDVAILDLPDPATLQLNRFFTAEFFAALKRSLATDGVVAFGLGRYENFLSRDLAGLLSCAHRTLQSVFAHVVLIPGTRVYFLASDGPLTLDLAGRLEQLGFETQWLNRRSLEVMLAADRLADLDRALAEPARINRDFSPVLYALELRRWLGQFGASRGARWPEWTLVAILAGYVALLPALPRVIFASGFAAAGLEVVLLIALQVAYGALYRQVGLVIALFMAGLAAGAVRGGGRTTSEAARLVAALGFAIAAIAAALAFILPQLVALDDALGVRFVGHGIILVAAALLGASVGAQFPAAGAGSAGGTIGVAARLFGADLLGAAAGALCVSVWLIPAFGVALTGVLTAALSLFAATLLWAQARSA